MTRSSAVEKIHTLTKKYKWDNDEDFELNDILKSYGKSEYDSALLTMRFYPPEQMQDITNRLIAGDELTICTKDDSAWINKYTKNPSQISMFVANLYIKIGLIAPDSGNTEIGEIHYNYIMARP